MHLAAELCERIRGNKGVVVAHGEPDLIAELAGDVLAEAEAVLLLNSAAMFEASKQEPKRWRALGDFEPRLLILIMEFDAPKMADPSVINWITNSASFLGTLFLLTTEQWEQCRGHPFVGPLISHWVNIPLPLNEEGIFSVGDLFISPTKRTVEDAHAMMDDGILNPDAVVHSRRSTLDAESPAQLPRPEAGETGISRAEFLKKIREQRS